MPWVRLDDEFPEHPKLISVGPLGMALQVAALCYSNAHLTDGFIQFNVVSKLLGWEFSPPGSDVIYSVALTSDMSGEDVDSKLVAGWLVDAGIWEQVQGGYFIHDYTDYQMTKEEIYALHETRTAVGKLGGRPRKNLINQNETNLVSKTKPNRNQTINQTPNQNESKTKPQSQSQSQSTDIPNNVIKNKDKSKARAAKPRDPLLDNQFVILYRDIMKTTPNDDQRVLIADHVTDCELFGAICHKWKAKGWNIRNVDGIIGAYLNGGIKENNNGHTPNGEEYISANGEKRII